MIHLLQIGICVNLLSTTGRETSKLTPTYSDRRKGAKSKVPVKAGKMGIKSAIDS